MDDAYYAQVNGYEAMRHPSVTTILDRERYEKWQQRMTAAWQRESNRLSGSVGMKATDMPQGLQQYLYQRLLDAEHLAPPDAGTK